MPIYEYLCGACGQRVEVIHGVHAERPVACEACGGDLRRALSVPAIVFKGSGWAKVDARKAPAAPKPASDKSAADGSADKSSPEGGKAAPAAVPDKGSPSAGSSGSD